MKNRKFYPLLIFLPIFLFLFAGVLHATTGEEELLSATNDPDALILLDLSGSMSQDPTGTYGPKDRYGKYLERYGTASCSGTTFYNNNSHSGYTTDCRKVTIAKRVIQDILDDTNNSVINSDDRATLGVRFGYMRFYNCAGNSAEGTKVYGATSACEPDKSACTGTGCGRNDGFCNNAITTGINYYSANTSCTADTINCAGSSCGRNDGFCDSSTAAFTYYSANAGCTADTGHCTGTGCGRTDGFCDSAVSGPTYYAAESCSTPNQAYGNCTGGYHGDCRDGFCNSSHSAVTYYAHSDCSIPDDVPFGCKDLFGFYCRGGFCSIAIPGCSKRCQSLGCTVACSIPCNNACYTTGCTNLCTSPSCAQDCGSTTTTKESWETGCNTLIAPINTLYSCIYCRDKNSCPYSPFSSCTNTAAVDSEAAYGGTHLAAALNEAKLYLDAHKLTENAQQRLCRKKFVILISDGDDTYGCSGLGTDIQKDQYKRRRESVAKAKLLADAGYKVFVIGFGQNMQSWSKNTLNWMAYYGGTDNPDETNSGTTTDYSIASGSYYPSGIESCQTSTTSPASSSPCNDNTAGCLAAANDPGGSSLGGYAFIAADTTGLTAALKTALNIIRESTYSFTQSSVQLTRTTDENYIYEASFDPVADDPFWRGHLIKYAINTDGSVGSKITNGDAGLNLQTRDGSSRAMYTLAGGSSLISFSTSINPSYFGYTDTASRDAVVGYIQGLSSYNPDSTSGVGVFKLGDVFRSTPIAVTTPSAYFFDTRDIYSPSGCTSLKSTSAFTEFRGSHCRASSCISTSDQGRRLIVVGANDGQLHAFKTSDMSEAWSFIPPNLLPKLKMITHSTDPSTLSHQLYVDGQVNVANVWLGSGNGTCKSSSDWKTLLAFGEGRGTNPYTWSNSQYCDSTFNSEYDSANYPHYCGYYALNLTDPSSPSFMWHLTGSGTNGAIESSRGPYLGDAWSKMIIGKIIDHWDTATTPATAVEKWVGFIGGGYNGANCSTTSCSTCDCRGKGFFVIDLSNGQILWSFTLGASDASTTNTNMKYSLPSDPGIVDTDNDGFIDTAYIGDLGGNMWRFKFCKNSSSTSCTSSNWSGARMFDGSTVSPVKPVYSSPTGAWDNKNNFWVYWGTGDKNDPMNIPTDSSFNRFFAVKDDFTTMYTLTGTNGLKNVTNPGTLYCNSSVDCGGTIGTEKGYYINFRADGEKSLSEALVFGGVVYFTTYVPTSSSETANCNQQGRAYLYGINFTTGAPTLNGGLASSLIIGTGIPSAPVVSMRPGGASAADLYITVSSGFSIGSYGGVAGVDTDRRAGGTPTGGECTGENCMKTGRGLEPPGLSNKTNILFWKDRRLE
jgi:Tfp pilus tip-associated adhesin PilY1